MSDDPRSLPRDLVTTVFLAVVEEGFIWQLEGYWLDGEFIAYPEANVAGRQQVLLRLLDAGLVMCYAYRTGMDVRTREVIEYEYDTPWRAGATEEGNFLNLAPGDARSLIADVTVWRHSPVFICRTDAALALTWDEWRETLRPTGSH